MQGNFWGNLPNLLMANGQDGQSRLSLAHDKLLLLLPASVAMLKALGGWQ
ncbi:MAG: hypothetical protein J0L73_18360 [Verrucomicrobia bacterium]|nr:hypothetical protein [Verrucomicrobiota bacterium]